MSGAHFSNCIGQSMKAVGLQLIYLKVRKLSHKDCAMCRPRWKLIPTSRHCAYILWRYVDRWHDLTFHSWTDSDQHSIKEEAIVKSTRASPNEVIPTFVGSSTDFPQQKAVTEGSDVTFLGTRKWQMMLFCLLCIFLPQHCCRCLFASTSRLCWHVTNAFFFNW